MPILPPSPFCSAISPSDGTGSLPSGEIEPSVTLASAPGESAAASPLSTGTVDAAADHRFALDEEAFMAAIEPMPLFLQAPIEALQVLARH